MFSSKTFIVSDLTFRSQIHFEFIFVYGVRECSNFILFFFLNDTNYHFTIFIFFKEFLYFYYLFIYLFLAVLGLRFCARAFSSCGKRGPLFIAVRWPLTITASLVAEHRPQMRRLSSCGSQAQLLCGMWNLPRPGLKPAFPALAGRL